MMLLVDSLQNSKISEDNEDNKLLFEGMQSAVESINDGRFVFLN